MLMNITNLYRCYALNRKLLQSSRKSISEIVKKKMREGTVIEVSNHTHKKTGDLPLSKMAKIRKGRVKKEKEGNDVKSISMLLRPAST